MWYEVNIKERRRRFVNSSSTLKNFLLLLNRNAFDLNLKATQLSDDKEFYIEMALRWNFTSCRQRWCFKKKKKRDAHYRAFTAVELLQMLEVAWLTAAVTSLSSLILELFWTQEVTGWRHYSEDLKNEWEPLLSGLLTCRMTGCGDNKSHQSMSFRWIDVNLQSGEMPLHYLVHCRSK